MRVISIVFGILNRIACVLSLIAWWREHRKLKKQGYGHANAKDAFEYVVHWLLLLWWVAGTVLIGSLEVNPFWILPWIAAWIPLYMFIERLAKVGGLAMLAQIGEVQLQIVAQESAAEFDKKTHNEQ